MNLRDLKLAIACENETEEVKSLNNFFDDLFSDLTIYTMDDKPDLIFMKGGKLIMEQDLENGDLCCRYDGFWSVLQDRYHCTYAEIQEIIQYKVEEAFKMGTLTPLLVSFLHEPMVEEAFKMGTLSPRYMVRFYLEMVEKAFKMGTLSPHTSYIVNNSKVEEAFKMVSTNTYNN